jgi:hypothetical protein
MGSRALILNFQDYIIDFGSKYDTRKDFTVFAMVYAERLRLVYGTVRCEWALP